MKCPYAKTCPIYDKESYTCNDYCSVVDLEGSYHCGKAREFAEQGK